MYDPSTSFDVISIKTGKMVANYAGGASPTILDKRFVFPEESVVKLILPLPASKAFLKPIPGVYSISFAYINSNKLKLEVKKDGSIVKYTGIKIK